MKNQFKVWCSLLLVPFLALTGCTPKEPLKPHVPTLPGWSTDAPSLDDALRPISSDDRDWFTTRETHANVLGACMTPKSAVTGRACVTNPRSVPLERDLQELGSWEYREYSQYLGIEAAGEIDVGANSGELKLKRDKYVLVKQWSRWKYEPADTQEKVAGYWVDGVRVGVGVRMILDVVITRVDTKGKVNYGISQLSTALATGNAKVQVNLAAIGAPDTVLPERSPIIISSPSEYGEVDDAFHRTLTQLIRKLEALPKGKKVHAGILAYHVGAPPPELAPLEEQPFVSAWAYVKGMKGLENGTSCVTALDAALKETVALIPYKAYVTAAFTDVYAVFTGNPKCDDASIGVIAQNAAREEMRAWEKRKAMSVANDQAKLEAEVAKAATGAKKK